MKENNKKQGNKLTRGGRFLYSLGWVFVTIMVIVTFFAAAVYYGLSYVNIMYTFAMGIPTDVFGFIAVWLLPMIMADFILAYAIIKALKAFWVLSMRLRIHTILKIRGVILNKKGGSMA